MRSRLVTLLVVELACDNIAEPACWSTWARVRFAVSDAKSASMMRLRAADWLSTEICRVATVARQAVLRRTVVQRTFGVDLVEQLVDVVDGRLGGRRGR